MKELSPSSWIAIATSAEIRDRPRRFVADGRAVVVFRSGADLRAFPDICPHRFAPLSQGRVIGGNIECPYHGWQYDGEGHCRHMPGATGALPRVRLHKLAVCESDGLVFLSPGPPSGTPYAGRRTDQAWVSTVQRSCVQSSLVDVAENILDAPHTHFTHRGLLRGLTARRHRVQVDITGGDGWVEARYEGEPQQEGIVSRLLEGRRGISIGRFLAPGIAEIEFWGPDRANLVTTFHLHQSSPGRVMGLGVLAAPRDHGLGYLRATIFRPLFDIALAQDRNILSAAARNQDMFGHPKPVIGPLDILRSSIEAIMAGRMPPAADRPVRMEMEL